MRGPAAWWPPRSPRDDSRESKCALGVVHGLETTTIPRVFACGWSRLHLLRVVAAQVGHGQIQNKLFHLVTAEVGRGQSRK